MIDIARDIDAVVIGGSAGGVEALSQIASALPARFAPALLVVLHVQAGRESGLARVIGAQCALPVTEAFDKQPIERGKVLIAPPDYHLLVEPDLTVSLSVDEPMLYSRPAIDPTFESAALVWGRRLLAVLLTGASADGSAGLAQVRRRGVAWVQDPASAAAPTMPLAAIESAGADAILTIEQICTRLCHSTAP